MIFKIGQIWSITRFNRGIIGVKVTSVTNTDEAVIVMATSIKDPNWNCRLWNGKNKEGTYSAPLNWTLIEDVA